MSLRLNERTVSLLLLLRTESERLRIERRVLDGGGELFDFGVSAPGGLQAGLWLARMCLAGLGEVSIAPGVLLGRSWPEVQVVTDHPVAACLYSQYAGWQLSVEKFFAMASGPMRAVAAREELFAKLGYRESAPAVVGVLEGRTLPEAPLYHAIAEKTAVAAQDVSLLIAPTASQAGNVQVVARVVETALHKLFELGFDVKRIQSAWGAAPLSPVAQDDLTGIGWTNDAILYGGRVALWVRGDDDSLAEIGPKVPADSSPSHGEPFLSIFEAAGRDFYKIDPHLFSPAEITFHNLDTGRTHYFGHIAPDVLRQSYALA